MSILPVRRDNQFDRDSPGVKCQKIHRRSFRGLRKVKFSLFGPKFRFLLFGVSMSIHTEDSKLCSETFTILRNFQSNFQKGVAVLNLGQKVVENRLYTSSVFPTLRYVD